MQKVPPTRQQSSIAAAFEKPLQQLLFVTLLPAEEVEESCQVVAWEAWEHTSKAEQKHVQITLRAGGLCQPPEFGFEVRDRVLREDVFDLAEQGSGAPQR